MTASPENIPIELRVADKDARVKRMVPFKLDQFCS